MLVRTVLRLGFIITTLGLGACQDSEFSADPGHRAPPPPEEPRSADQAPPRLIEKTVTNQGVSEGNATLSTAGVETELTQSRVGLPFALTFKQNERPVELAEFTQGTTGTPVEEQFLQNDYGILDLLVVMDNSGSMAEEQANMSTKLAALLTYVKDANWRIGVVTTDPNDGCLKTVIAKTDPDHEALFKAAIMVGTGGSGNERGILQAYNSLKGTCLAQPWIRQVSNLAVLIVADEDNCSDGNDCAGEPYQKSKYLTDYLQALRKDKDEAKVYGLIWQPDVNKADCTTGYYQGKIYAEAIKDTAGKSGSICANDYSDTLKQISLDLFLALKVSYKLKAAPSDGTLKVMVGDTDMTKDVTLMGDVIKFKKAPPKDSKIRVSYRVGATPVVKRFKIAKDLDEKQLVVVVNGDKLTRKEFDYDTEKGELVLNDSPSDLAKISVRFRGKKGLERAFSMKRQVKKGRIKVTVDGHQTGAFDVDDATGTISFSEEPADGAEIRAEAFVAGEPILRYPFETESREILSAFFKDDPGKKLDVVVENGALRFKAEDFREGGVVVVSYRDALPQGGLASLPHTPMQGSVTLEDTPDCAADSVVVIGSVVMTNCTLPRQGIKVAYRYVTGDPLKTMTLDDVNDPEHAEWRVLVDGKSYLGFTRTGNVITFVDPLPPGAQVIVKAQVNI